MGNDADFALYGDDVKGNKQMDPYQDKDRRIISDLNNNKRTILP